MQTSTPTGSIGDLRRLAPDSQAPPSQALTRPPYPWKTRLLLPLLLLAGLAATFALAAGPALWPATEVRVVPVVLKASSVQAAGGSVVAQAAGWVEADPYAISVTSLADGVVQEVLVLEGQKVEAGHVVALLVSDDARLALAKAEAELAARRAALDAAQQDWRNPIERNRAVAVAEAMVAETTAEMLRAEAQAASEAARLSELAEELKQAQQSHESGAATELEFITAKLRHDAQQGTLAAAQAQPQVLEAQLRQREADMTAAQRNQELRIPEVLALATAEAAVMMAEAQRDEAALRLARMEVRSAASGIVLSRHVEPGSKLMLGMDDPLSATTVRLYDPNKLQVRVDVPLADAAKVGVGMAAQVVVDVLPDQVFQGAVTRIVQEADVAKNTLQVKVAIRNPSAQLKPEMLARVRFLAPASAAATDTGQHAQVVFAPNSLIHRDGASAAAWVVDRRNSVARRRSIELGGARQDGWVAVVSGLNAGDQVIADASNLKDGQRIRVVGEARLPGATEGGDHGVH